MLVVLDTNVLISAFISAKGAPAQLLNLWRAGQLEIVTCQESIDEIERVFTYPHIRFRLRFDDDEVQQFLTLLRDFAVFQEDVPGIDRVSADQDDDKFLALALASSAAHIVSGDNHLLAVGAYQGITILTPAAFLASFTPTTSE